MGDGWVVGKHYLDTARSKWMYVLKRSDGPSFMDDFIRKEPQAAARIGTTAIRIFDNGVGWALESGTLARIKGTKGSVVVFETRVKGDVLRVATHLHKNRIPIYLFIFKTHAGSNNNLPEHDKQHAVDMARHAADCARNYDFGEE